VTDRASVAEAIDSGTMEEMSGTPKDALQDLRETGDPRLTDADREILRQITRGSELALELSALAADDPELTS
jgi:hypothetical protein